MNIKVDISHADKELEHVLDMKVKKIKPQVINKAQNVSEDIRNQVLKVLSGNRSGKTYTYRNAKGSMTTYTASAPGEPPAVRTGFLRNSFKSKTEKKVSGNTVKIKASAVSNTTKSAGGGKGNSNYNYAWIDQGNSRVAPRPYARKVLFNAMEIYIKDLKRGINA